jgi:hypothetical protein
LVPELAVLEVMVDLFHLSDQKVPVVLHKRITNNAFNVLCRSLINYSVRTWSRDEECTINNDFFQRLLSRPMLIQIGKLLAKQLSSKFSVTDEVFSNNFQRIITQYEIEACHSIN